LYTSIFRNAANVDFRSYHNDIRNNNKQYASRESQALVLPQSQSAGMILADHNDNMAAKHDKKWLCKMQNNNYFLWRLRD